MILFTAFAYLKNPFASLRNFLWPTYYCLIFLNLYVFDLKDKENDRLAGIRTFANTLPKFFLIYSAMTMALLLALLAPFYGRDPWRWPMAFSFFAFAMILATLLRQRSTSYFFSILDFVGFLPLLTQWVLDAGHSMTFSIHL